MTGGGWGFKRLVLDLHRNGQDPATLRHAAEIAEFLHLDLFGRFIDDPAIARLAGLPFAREFRVLEREWHDLAVAEVTRARELAIATASRLFAEAARASTARCRFEVLPDPGGTKDAGGHCDEDIVVLHQKPHAGESFSRLLDTAFEHASAVLIMPNRVIHRHGPVVAVARSPDDPSIAVAASLATEAGEAFLYFDSPDGGLSPDDTEAVFDRGRPRGAGRGNPRVRRLALPVSNECLIVLTRGVLADADVSTVVSCRRVPVLVLRA
ncbi:MAG TPA: hypothetical protein VN809_08600 [Telmatospirillum sp.]|nr:hypothetical protein [Telmatospirillum sp.]